MQITTKRLVIQSYGKGGNTSSGNWHIHYSKVATDYTGKPYTQELTKSFFTKSAMNQWLEANA